MKSLMFLIVAAPLLAWSHGENTLGPNGGHIRMPGAFHTELSLAKDQSVHIYLLDMEFKNPTVEDSSVEVFAKNGKTEIKFACSIMSGNHFHCLPEKKYSPRSEIVVNAVREKAKGNAAIYKLPLQELEHAHH